MNPVGCLSINHRVADVALRERIDIAYADLRALLAQGGEAYAVTTCNRAEVYWVGLQENAVIDLIARRSGLESDAISRVVQRFSGPEALRHLCLVASGLDSLVLGEPQILGQVKEAYREAVASGTTGLYLNKALHRAFRAAKRVRSETDIGRYPVSVASEAVELAGHIFDDIRKSRVLVIGAGDMGTIAAKRLKDKGVSELIILNRTYANACALACELDGTPRDFANLKEELAQAQIVITSTGSKEPIIAREMMSEVMKLRKSSPMIIIDIAVPRDVQPEVGKLYNCYLYDIDALKTIVDKHFTTRQLSLDQARVIIDHEVLAFEQWLESLTVQASIKDLYALMEGYARDQARSMAGSEEERVRMEQMLGSALKRFLHRPVSFLREHPSLEHIDYTRRIFQLDEDYTDRHKG
ncbi:MAG: glutamyl-tRNA reductase [Syntrophaceae bacterium]